MDRVINWKRILLLCVLGVSLLVLAIVLITYTYSQRFENTESLTTGSNSIEVRYMSEISGIETPEELQQQYERHPKEYKFAIDEDLVVMFAYPDSNIQWTGMVFIHHFPSVSEITLDYDGIMIHNQITLPEVRLLIDDMLDNEMFINNLQIQMSEIWDLDDPGKEVLDLVDALDLSDSKVEFIGGRPQTLFEASMFLIRVNDQDVSVYKFDNETTRRSISENISPDGYEITQKDGEVTTVIHIEYLDLPNFWAKGNLLAQYLGTDQTVIDLLSFELGDPLTSHTVVSDGDSSLGSSWQTYTNAYFNISLNYPAHWQHVDEETHFADKFAGEDGFFTITAMGDAGLIIDKAVETEIQHNLHLYGPNPYIEEFQVQGREARIILPSVSQDNQLRRQAAVLVLFPQPISLSIGNTKQAYPILALYADPIHIRGIAESLKFDVKGIEESGLNKGTENDFSCLLVSPISLKIFCPENYALTPMEEQNRRGSFAAYRFTKQSESQPPSLKEVQFFTAESIDTFIRKCDEISPCFFGTYPTPKLFFDLTLAYKDREPFQDYSPKIFVDRYFLVKNTPCYGDTCVIREYVSFFEDVMMVVWIAMDDSAQSNLSDMLFNQVFFVQD